MKLKIIFHSNNVRRMSTQKCVLTIQVDYNVIKYIFKYNNIWR